jgi:hypothetical protein
MHCALRYFHGTEGSGEEFLAAMNAWRYDRGNRSALRWRRQMSRRLVLLAVVLATALGYAVGRGTAPGLPAHAARPPAVPFAGFAGTWFTHGGVMHVGAGGKGFLQVRTYVNCNQNRLTNCDTIIGNVIYSGGFVTFTLNRLEGNVARGTITNSSTSWQFQTPLSLRRNPNDTIRVSGPRLALRFCGPHAPTSACGA